MAEDPITWTDLKTSVRSWLDVETGALSDERLEECIAYAERHFNRNIFVPDRESALSISASAQSTALPADFWGFKSPPYIDAATDIVLQKITPAGLRAAYPTSSTGTPAHYAIEGENILVGPTPASAQTIKGTYYSTIAPLNAGTATNWLLTDHPDIYLHGAMHYCCLFMKDETRAGLHKSQMAALIEDLSRAGRRRSNSGAMAATHSVQHIPNIQA